MFKYVCNFGKSSILNVCNLPLTVLRRVREFRYFARIFPTLVVEVLDTLLRFSLQRVILPFHALFYFVDGGADCGKALMQRYV